jgi:type IV secretion system protein VirD4
MIGRAGYDLLRFGGRVAVQLWPLWLFWWAWDLADSTWQHSLPGFSTQPFFGLFPSPQQLGLLASPTAALIGPAIVMAAGILLHRMQIGSWAMARTGLLCMTAAAILTCWPDFQRLWPKLGTPENDLGTLFNAIDRADVIAIITGVFVAFLGYCIATRQPAVGSRTGNVQRGRSGNHGHGDWLSIKAAQQLFTGPHPAYGGLVVGEAYRVDQDAIAKRRFDPRDRRTWGTGGRAPLLIDPCLGDATHALVFAGAGGFKTTAVAIPTLLTWTGATVVLDPSREIGPMMTEYRAQTLGHRVVALDPTSAVACGFNALDWIDPTAPLAEDNVDAVVGWIMGEHQAGASSGGKEFFRDKAWEMLACLLADMLWDPELPAHDKTLRTLRARLTVGEKTLRASLEAIHRTSHSRKARDLAATLMQAVEETFSGICQNATRETRWLSNGALADLVSGATFKTRDLTAGKLTVFVQIPLHVLQNTPGLARVIIGALVNSVYEADGHLRGRVLFLLDEAARLGYMSIIEIARDAGRKYGVTFLLLYQSLGQLIQQWGIEGKRAWYGSSAWRMFAAIQDLETAREVSAMCGDYTVLSTSTGDSESNQSRGAMGGSTSAGRSENRSEIKRPLIRPEELLQDCRKDEAFVISAGNPPLRCGRAIYFRRRDWDGLVGRNRFHRDDIEAAE